MKKVKSGAAKSFDMVYREIGQSLFIISRTSRGDLSDARLKTVSSATAQVFAKLWWKRSSFFLHFPVVPVIGPNRGSHNDLP